MAAPVEVTKASEFDSNTGQTEGMTRMGAVVNKASICASGIPPRHLSIVSRQLKSQQS